MGARFIRIGITVLAVLLGASTVCLGAYVAATKDKAVEANGLAVTADNKADKANDKIDRLSDIFLPVVSNMGYTRSWADNGFLYIEVWGSKMRKCSPPLRIEALGLEDFQQTYEVRFMNDINVDGSFRAPTEKEVSAKDELVSFGVWRLKPIPQQRYWFSVVHNCGGQLVSTNFLLQDYTGKFFPVPSKPTK
jgi:hypothetical protein